MNEQMDIFWLKKHQVLLMVGLLISNLTASQETIKFPSKDSIQISADAYIVHDLNEPFIILFHQATFSRGEYLEVAPKLNKAGFNCMAVDLRSGKAVNGIKNITHENTKKASMPYRFIDTYQDIEASVDYVLGNFAKGQLIIWGSSYSASLVIKYAGEHEDVDGIVSFSPGEYFKNEGKSVDFIKKSASRVEVPIFVTSKGTEKDNWLEIYSSIPGKKKSFFLPDFEGKHGSVALWETSEGNEKYWKAVTLFLSDFL